jgi:hypothetical protein
MKPDKVPPVTTTSPPARRPGRPRKLSPQCVRFNLSLPPELADAGERFRQAKALPNLPDAVRQLIREGAQARGLLG